MVRLLVLLLCACLLPFHARAGSPPPVMLAGQWRDGADVSQYWVSEKLDGVRARWDGKILWTRAGNRIGAPAGFTAGWPTQPLDGELWIAQGRFDEVSAITRTSPPRTQDWRQIRFMAFDLPAHPGPFSQRLTVLQGLVRSAGKSSLSLIPQQRVADNASLQRLLQSVVASDGEGLMLHHQNNRYLTGRSEGLLKLKPWQDAEAWVVGHLPGKGKYTGMLGALLVQRSDGARFRLGSGLKDAQRANPPGIGTLVTYRYNGFTATGLPRFARFLRVRDEPPPADPAR
jgi:DNA ligase-1